MPTAKRYGAAIVRSSNKPRISALVVTWNSAQALPGLVRSLGRGDDELELVQVDNASSDDSLGLGSEWRGPLAQVANAENVGFAAALQQAVAAAHGELLLIVNPDVELERPALDALVERIDSDPGVAAVGPKLLDAGGKVELACARRLPSLQASLLQALGLHRLVAGTMADPYTYPVSAYDVERDVPCLSGAAMLIRRSVLESVGGVDPRWFMYFEDIDICARLGEAGWRLGYCPRAVARHQGAASSPRSTDLAVWLAVHLNAAVNLFFAVHRRRTAAAVHRLLTAIGGLARLLGGAALLVASPATARHYLATGRALLVWAATRRLPPGGPPRAQSFAPTAEARARAHA